MSRDPEQRLWDDIRDAMVGRWHAQRHEDRYSTGIPDVSFGIERKSEGWIELKHLNAWPASAAGSPAPWDFSIAHFTPEQRNWMTLRTKHGTGRVFLLCRFEGVGVVVWNWKRIQTKLGKVSLGELLRAANAQWWHSPIDPDELARALAGNRVIPPRYQI